MPEGDNDCLKQSSGNCQIEKICSASGFFKQNGAYGEDEKIFFGLG